MKKIIILTCMVAGLSFAGEKNDFRDDSEYAQIFEQMKSALATIKYQEKKKIKDVYLSAKIYDNIGDPGYVYFGSDVEFGAISYRNNMLFSGELSGGFWNWGAGFNLGFLFELPNSHLIIPGFSTGAWFSLNFENDYNRNDDNYDYQFMLGGPFVKYLIGKNKRFFEISARALMGWAEKYGYGVYDGHDEDDYYDYPDCGYGGLSKAVFLINLNIGIGITVLF